MKYKRPHWLHFLQHFKVTDLSRWRIHALNIIGDCSFTTILHLERAKTKKKTTQIYKAVQLTHSFPVAAEKCNNHIITCYVATVHSGKRSWKPFRTIINFDEVDPTLQSEVIWIFFFFGGGELKYWCVCSTKSIYLLLNIEKMSFRQVFSYCRAITVS